MRYFLFLILVAAATSCGSSISPTNSGNANTAKPALVSTYTYEVVKTYPHDVAAFTQGLELHNGFFYEGTGGYGDDSHKSSLRKVEIDTGKVLQRHNLAPEYFGEGITILGDKIFQLTWKEGKAFVYDLNDFRLLQEFDYPGQGWGLTNDGTNLYQSDSTHVLRVVDPQTFKTIRTIVVLDERSKPIMELNELEWVKGEIWANVYQTGWIVRIDPQTGKLLGRIDLNTMADEERKQNKQAEVLNGIAYDEATDRIFVTGKQWRRLFEIKVKPKA